MKEEILSNEKKLREFMRDNNRLRSNTELSTDRYGPHLS